MAKKKKVVRKSRASGVKKPKEADPKVKEAESKSRALMKALKQPELWLAEKKIADKPQFHKASSVLTWCKEHKAQCEKERKELVTPLNGVVKKINARFKEVTGPTDKLASHISRLMADYDQRQRELAEKKVEKEAKRAERNGDHEFAADLRDNAIRTKPDLPTEGLVSRDIWSSKVDDLDAALVAFLEGHAALKPAREEILAVIQSHASKVARALKTEELGIPGCKGVRSTSFARKS